MILGPLGRSAPRETPVLIPAVTMQIKRARVEDHDLVPFRSPAKLLEIHLVVPVHRVFEVGLAALVVPDDDVLLLVLCRELIQGVPDPLNLRLALGLANLCYVVVDQGAEFEDG